MNPAGYWDRTLNFLTRNSKQKTRNFFMRILGHIPHPSITITVFSMNDKHLVKFEAGPMEQVFKFSNSIGMDQLTKIIDDQFMSEITNRFNEMFLQLKRATK